MSEIVMITWVLIIEAIVRNNLAIFEIQSMFANEVDEAYIFIFFNFACMMISGMFLLRLSYQPNQIIPFPINEDCISNFVVAIIMPTSMTHFYQYLQNLDDYDEALIIFGLHADIRIYMRMYEEREFFTRDQIHNKAVQIFEDYIIEDCKWGMRAPEIMS